jgi:hypothetical protein
METLIINVPEKKSTLVKLLLKELGVKIQNKAKARQLAKEINSNIMPGPKPDFAEILSDIKTVREQ